MRINRSIISNQTESVPVVRTLTINGTTYDLTQNRTWTVSGGGVTGSGTTNYLSKWTSGTALGNSLVYDNGTNVLVNTTTDQGQKFQVNGDALIGGLLTITGSSALPAQTATYIRFGSGFSSPVIGRMYIGDGTGWKFHMAKRISSTTTDLITFQDNGNVGIKNQNPSYTLDVNGGIYGKGITSDIDGSVGNAIYAHNQVLTGSTNNALVQLDTTWNTTGNPNAIELNVTNTTSGSTSKLINLKVGSVTKFNVSKAGAIQTAEPTGYTAKPWKLGDATSGTITPDYYIKVEIDGQIYSIPALLGTP